MLQEISLILKDFFNVTRDVKFGINPLSANLTKWSSTLNLSAFAVFEHFVWSALKGLNR